MVLILRDSFGLLGSKSEHVRITRREKGQCGGHRQSGLGRRRRHLAADTQLGAAEFSPSRQADQAAPTDWYALGAHRGGIDERWFASTTEAANDNRAADEGLSYAVFEGQRFLLRDAVAEAGLKLIGKTMFDK